MEHTFSVGHSGQSLASNGPVVDSRDLNLVFSPTEATHNKLFPYSPTKYAEPSWMLVLLLGDAMTTNMPVNFDYFCDFIDIFDDGNALTNATCVTISDRGQRNSLRRRATCPPVMSRRFEHQTSYRMFWLGSFPVLRENTLEVVRGLPPLTLPPTSREDFRLDDYLEQGCPTRDPGVAYGPP
ncbi:hypothetical protein TNCV_3521651 [Trichonephila clavipes]|nr:hypothetical protein TNCV_3521651 [Trichonephila clavipes]